MGDVCCLVWATSLITLCTAGIVVETSLLLVFEVSVAIVRPISNCRYHCVRPAQQFCLNEAKIIVVFGF